MKWPCHATKSVGGLSPEGWYTVGPMAETPDDGELSEPLKGVGARQQSLRWTIPEPLAVCETHGLDGAPITPRRHGNPDGPRLVLSHANGLSADSYYPFWSLLSDRFDLVLYDFRNHGWNPGRGSPHAQHSHVCSGQRICGPSHRPDLR